MSKEFFFRNDDVRETLDPALMAIQQIFIKRRIPIAHAVEPANVSQEVISWLNRQKEKHPEGITLMQHGYNHRIKNKNKIGEFGGQRNYSEQREDMHIGKNLMNKYFGSNWFPAFNFPYDLYNQEAIEALNSLDYKIFNSHYYSDWKRRLFYFFGHVLGRGLLLGHHVSWNLRIYPGTSIIEVSVSINFIKRYVNENTECEFCSFDQLKAQINRYSKSRFPIGMVLHHRYYTKEDHFYLITRILDYLQKNNFTPVRMEEIFERLRTQSKAF